MRVALCWATKSLLWYMVGEGVWEEKIRYTCKTVRSVVFGHNSAVMIVQFFISNLIWKKQLKKMSDNKGLQGYEPKLWLTGCCLLFCFLFKYCPGCPILQRSPDLIILVQSLKNTPTTVTTSSSPPLPSWGAAEEIWIVAKLQCFF